MKKELGFVIGYDSVVYRVYDDGSWSVSNDGVNFPGAAKEIESFYKNFSEFPYPPGSGKLRNLADRTGGFLVWHDQPVIPGAEF